MIIKDMLNKPYTPRYNETSNYYPASEHITFENTNSQPYAFNNAINTDYVFGKYNNDYKPDNTTYENPNGLPFDRIITTPPLVTKYNFDNRLIETSTYPNYGNNLNATNHGKYVKVNSEMEYSRLKEPIETVVKEQQLIEKDIYLPGDILRVLNIDENQKMIPKHDPNMRDSPDEYIPNIYRNTININEEETGYNPKETIDELRAGKYSKNSNNSADVYRMETEIKPKIITRGNKRFSNIEGDFNNNLPLYLQNKNVVDVKNNKYTNKPNIIDSHTNKLIKNSDNELIQDKYAIDENILPEYETKRTKEDRMKINRDKVKDNNKIEPTNQQKRKENFKNISQSNNPFKRNEKADMINDNESRNQIYMSMRENNDYMDYSNFSSVNNLMTQQEQFYNNISNHQSHKDFMDKFDRKPVEDYPLNVSRRKEAFAAPRSNYGAAETSDMIIKDSMTKQNHQMVDNRNFDNYGMTKYMLSNVREDYDNNNDMTEFKLDTGHHKLVDYISINLTPVYGENNEILMVESDNDIPRRERRPKKTEEIKDTLESPIKRMIDSVQNGINKMKDKNKKPEGNNKDTNQKENRENNRKPNQNKKEEEIIKEKTFEKTWDKMTQPFQPRYNRFKESFEGSTNLSTATNTYLSSLQAFSKALVVFVSSNKDFAPWNKYWNYLIANINKCKNLYEILDRDAEDVAYVQNKGDHMRFRIRDKQQFVPLNIYTYVLVHELAHLANGEEWGHGTNFQRLMHLLEVAAFELNILQPDKYPSDPYFSNGTGILTKESIKEELLEGIEEIIKNGGNNKYYNDLANYIRSK